MGKPDGGRLVTYPDMGTTWEQAPRKRGKTTIRADQRQQQINDPDPPSAASQPHSITTVELWACARTLPSSMPAPQ
jgi:hypothetical protein